MILHSFVQTVNNIILRVAPTVGRSGIMIDMFYIYTTRCISALPSLVASCLYSQRRALSR